MSTVGNSGAAAAAQAAARAAAEAARRAAEEAARRAAAEAARQAAAEAARQAAAEATRQAAAEATRQAAAQATRPAPAAQTPRQAPAAPNQAAAAQTTRASAESGMARLVERHNGPKPMLDLSGGAAPRMPAGTSTPSGGGMSLSQLQSALKSNNVPVYDRQAAEGFFGQFDYAPEGAKGTQLVESIAVMALNGGKPDFGDDKALNCVQAAAVGQDYFNNLNPPVKTEIVVAEEHAVLRMPDGSYYDPSLAMDDEASTSPYLTREEGARYDGIPGVTVADRERIENGAMASANAQPKNATAEQREQAAIRGATQTASGMGEVGALLFANKTEASVTTSEDGTSITVRAEVDLDAPFQPGVYASTSSDVRHKEEPGLVTMETRTVTSEVGFKTSIETPDKLPVSVEGHVLTGSRDTSQVTMSEADWALVESGQAPAPTIWDPSSIPVGGSILVQSDNVQGTGLEVAMGRLAKVTLGSETTETSGHALSVERTGDTTVRVTSGPTESVTQAMSVGLKVGDVSAGVRNEKSLATAEMQTAEFDLSVPEAKAAYDHLLLTGEYPPPGTPGVTGNGTVTSATATDTLSAGVNLFGWVEVSKTLQSNEANVTRTVFDDGTSQERYDFNIDDKKAVISRSYDQNGVEQVDQQQASVLFTSLPGESSFHLFAAFEGGVGAQQEPFMGGNEYVAEVTLTDAEAKQMQARAQERVAQETNEEGVNTSDPFILALAEADTPEEVSAVMVQYGGSDGQTSQQLLDLMRFTSNGEPLPGSVTFKPKE